MIRLRRRDLWLGKHPIRKRLGLWPAQRIRTRAVLNVLWLPSRREVPIHVIAARAILVDAAIAIVVDPFLASHDPVAVLARSIRLWFARYGNHSIGIARIAAVCPKRIGPPHLGDMTVAIHVVRTIFIGNAIAVIVDGLLSSACRIRSVCVGKPLSASVRIHQWNEVESAAINQFGDLGNGAIAREQVPRRIQHGLASLDFVGMNSAIDIHGGLGAFVAGLAIVDDHRQERSSQGSGANALHAAQRWIRLRQLKHVRLQRLHITKAVEWNFYFGSDLLLCMRSKAKTTCDDR